MGKIEAKGLSYSYSDGFMALKDLNFTIEAGEFVCVVGHSGCGKSTLLRLISGLVDPSAGELLIDGRSVQGSGLDRAVVFQQYSLFPWLTAQKNVALGIRQAFPGLPKKQADKRAYDLLMKVGIERAANLYPYQLSGGMKQRVAIARAFGLDSDTLLLDEPFGALDQKRRADLQRLLLDMWQSGESRKTVVFVTHDIDEAILLADRIFYMRPGCIATEIDLRREMSDCERFDRCSVQNESYERVKLQLDALFALDTTAGEALDED